MAERRFSDVENLRAARHVVRLFEDLAPTSDWCVQDAADSVLQPFYAALDTQQRLCWTDDRSRAEHFGSKQAAERFAADRVTTDVCVVPCR